MARTAMVTGAANGIGRAIAEEFLREGFRVAMVDIDLGSARAAAEELAALGDVEPIGCDIADRAQVEAAVARCLERFGGLDVLAANAAIADGADFLDIDERDWRRIVDVNLNGTFFCVQAAARAMATRGSGAIVVTSSTNAWYVEGNLAHYNASKGGVVALVRSAPLDLAKRGIRVNAVEPSMVRTRSAFITFDPVGGPQYLERVPMGRFAEPREVAQAVLFLASDKASYITGQTLVIDGGLTLGIDMPLPIDPIPGSLRADDAREE
jgi:2-hydroxycyclohexanecarboxyl-CoA dehydrogenase